jgi:Raf kinase inhibitor-like YbhB/YbcL family protein
MNLISSAFANEERIPADYTCEGRDVSPPLSWDDVPNGASELALTCEDPDAPRGTFVHWVIWGIDPTLNGLEEGAVPAGAHLGRNDFGRAAYGGPCPPPGHGTHHYNFTLYALSAAVDLNEGSSLNDLRRAVEGNVLAEASLVGTYDRE